MFILWKTRLKVRVYKIICSQFWRQITPLPSSVFMLHKHGIRLTPHSHQRLFRAVLLNTVQNCFLDSRCLNRCLPTSNVTHGRYHFASTWILWKIQFSVSDIHLVKPNLTKRVFRGGGMGHWPSVAYIYSLCNFFQLFLLSFFFRKSDS